jgi:hypothetical protein
MSQPSATAALTTPAAPTGTTAALTTPAAPTSTIVP